MLSATLIVRDEERHIDACLHSIRGLVDEIVVVDTGSRDRTREIACDHGARLIETEWRGDFAAARNLALDHARGDWALYIDADERASGGAQLRDTLENPAAVAGLVRFRAQTGFTQYWEYRLFRIDPAIRFRSNIHETILPDIRKQVGRGRVVVETDLALDHLGYDGDRTVKYRRDIPLIERALQTDPGRIYLWFALGAAWRGLGEAQRAEEAWARGLGYTRADLGERGPTLALISGAAGERHRAGSSAARWVELAIDLQPDHPLTSWMRAREALIAGSPEQAVPLLETLVSTDPEQVIEKEVGVDSRIFREGAYELLGVCRLLLDEPAQAAEWLRKAEAATGGADVGVRIKRQLAEARAQRNTTHSAVD